MKEDVNAQIQSILTQRNEVCGTVQTLQQQWQRRQKKAQTLRQEISEIKRLCLRARSTAGSDLAAVTALERVLAEFDSRQTLKQLGAGISFAAAQMDKLMQRFNRKTVNIAVAGVGRCGKSTALKSIIGGDQSDNSVIPSGSGPAITAGKSTLCSVLSEAEERTVVRFHTEKSFLDEVVNPLLSGASLSEYQCTDADDFAGLDFALLREALSGKSRAAQDAVSGTELAVHQADEADKAAARARFEQAKAYAASFNTNDARLDHVVDIWNNFPKFRVFLAGGTESVPLKQTYRYVSYPKSKDEAAVCYAVKETFIYCRFPGNSVQSLQLIDLPGLGTSSQSERKCFLDGFNYSVDLALMLRRPEGLFQNFPTKDDLDVLDVLSATFGENLLHACMVLFQNDANLPQADIESACQKVAEWNRSRRRPVTVLRGDARSASFMQGELLPKVLAFLLDHLPSVDRALLDAVLPQLKKQEEAFDTAVLALENALGAQKHLFPSNSGAIAIADRAEKIRIAVMNGLGTLMHRYVQDTGSNDTASAEVGRCAATLRTWAKEHYNPQDDVCLEPVRNAIKANLSAVPFANAEIHAIRIRITEEFSSLEGVHAQMIRDMQSAVAGIFRQTMPTLVSEEGALSGVMDVIRETNECPQLLAAIQELHQLSVPFYNVVYPDLRKHVFDSMEGLERNFLLDSSESLDKRAKIVVAELQNTAIHWVWKTENLLNTQNRIVEILCAALERFEDRVIRNETVRREWIALVESRWGLLQNDGHACLNDIRGRMDKILNQGEK